MIHHPILYNNTDWVRPADWLPIDHLVTSTDDKMVILFAIYPDSQNKIAYIFRVGTVIDWGDGTVTEGNNTIAEHTYNYDSIPDSTLCSRGYKQVIITVYPLNSSYHITRLYLAKHSEVGQYSQCRILEMKIRAPWCDSFRLSNGTVPRTNIMESFVWIDNHSLGINHILFYFCFSLINFRMDYLSARYFYACNNLTPPFSQSPETQTWNSYYYNNAKIINYYNLTATNQVDAGSMFYGSFSIEDVEMNMSGITAVSNMFYNNYHLRRVVLHNMESITINTTMFALNYSLTEVLLYGLKLSFNIGNCSMSATALNNLFTSLGTPATTQTVTVTGNPGAATCNTSIATAKNWTVIIT